jgi:hypothetical protein
MTENIASTNTILTIVAVATVIQAAIAVGAVVFALVLYSKATRAYHEVQRQVARRIDDLERQMAPLLARVDHALGAVERVDATVDRVTSTVRAKAIPAIGLIRGARMALNVLLR